MGDWPPDYRKKITWRFNELQRLSKSPTDTLFAKAYYKTHPIEFIEDWCNTYDPRNAGTGRLTSMPFLMFPRQHELVQFLHQLITSQENGLIEKARDMGATWVSCAFSVWLWLFRDGAAIGWGSRKEQLVDKLGDPDSIFEKIRMLINGLPVFFLPVGFAREHATYMKIINPENGATITGESGDNIGRGGRKLIYFKDESAYYERPEKIEAALADNTNVQIDISSVNGVGNVFHRRRESGALWGGEVVAGRTNVFVMDWRDHPAKDQEWYDKRKAKAKEEGLLHVFYQEVDRDYASSVEGVLVPSEWFDAAIDAHIALGIPVDGGTMGALDVADEGVDSNAYTERRGIVLIKAESWAIGDTGETTRKAVGLMSENTSLQYDCIGVGAGVKAESNRLKNDNLLPKGISFTPWHAGASVLDPKKRIIPGDSKSPTNTEFFENLKAQASWELKLRFERTYAAARNGEVYQPSQLISISSTLPRQVRDQLKKELAQITIGKSSRLKMIVNKKGQGMRSPNIADSVIMNYFPVGANYDIGKML